MHAFDSSHVQMSGPVNFVVPTYVCTVKYYVQLGAADGGLPSDMDQS